LARKPARDDIHQPTPRETVEGSDVVPHREGVEAPVVLSGEQHAPGILIDFDGTDGAPSEEFASENAASSARE
jgi:hypothetical protein